MQKIQEAPDRKWDEACAKGNRLGKRKKSSSLLAVAGEVARLKSFLLLVEGLTCSSLGYTLVNLLLVASVSFTNDPRLPTPNNNCN